MRVSFLTLPGAPSVPSADRGPGSCITHILSCDTGELHASFHFIQNFPFSHEVMNVLQKARSYSPGVAGVCVKGFDDLFDGYRSVTGSPGIKVGRCADEGVTEEVSRIRLMVLSLSKVSHTRSRPLERAWLPG